MQIKEFIEGLASKGCGEDLEYDSDFLELQRLIAGGEESQYGEHVYVAEPIDWIAVESLSLALFQRTHDVRVGVCLTRAWLEREGISGFAKGLQVVAYLVCERWDNVHPQLSAAEQFDPLMRINALAELAVPGTVMVALRRQPLATTETKELLTVADLALIAGGVESAERTACQATLERLIEPHCSAELMRSLGLLNQMLERLQAISNCLDERTGLSAASPLQPLSQQLQQWLRVVEGRLRNTLAGLPPVTAAASPGALHYPDAAVPVRIEGECRSRAEVVAALKAVEAYYQRHEPSSPVPMLVRRVRRLAGMDFMEIIAELAPSSVNDLRTLGGCQDE